MKVTQMMIEDLIAAHLRGEAVEVPEANRIEFQFALTANRMLTEFLEQTNPGHAESESAARQLPPRLSQEYEIRRELGRGGMGVVYLAYQKSLGREVALKVLRPGEHAAEALCDRFRAEAQHLASLRHPNIVSIHEVGEAGNEPYFTMDFIDGETLSTLLLKGPLSPSQSVQILEQIAQAVLHAHQQGIIHRDLKPGNVLLDRSGHVFVTDFGLARNVTADSQLTRTGELLGTPQYMAPEQARGDNELIGEATDIYALGLLLFEMLTGQRAFAAASPADLIVKVLQEEATPVRRLDRRIPRDLETICQKMLQKAPAARYANVSALLEDLQRYKSGEPLMARRPNPIVRTTRRLIRAWKPITAVFVTALIVLAASFAFMEKPYHELVAWGDEELSAGNPEMAASVYSRAFDKGDDSQRRQVIERMVRVIGRVREPKTTIDLARKIISVSPHQSFGKQDFLIAMALISEARTRSPEGAISIWVDHDPAEIGFLAERLKLGLANYQGNPQQKIDAEKTLEALEIILKQRQAPAHQSPEGYEVLPVAEDDALEQLARDERNANWTRGKCALVLGRRCRARGETDQALRWLQQSLDLIRPVFPVYAGMVESNEAANSDSPPDSAACRLIQELIAEIRELDPGAMPEPAGGILFDVQAPRQASPAAETRIRLNLELCAIDQKNPNAGLPFNLPRLVPVRPGKPVKLGVLDGRYRLTFRGTQSSYAVEDADLMHRLRVDLDGWPTTIEISGNTVSLPPVVFRLTEPIELKTPAHGSQVDLNQAEFSWGKIAGAEHYRIQFSYTHESPTPVVRHFLTVRSAEPSCRLSQLTDFEKKLLRENLLSGRTGGWQVEAIDRHGKSIGRTATPSQFLVLRELDPLP